MFASAGDDKKIRVYSVANDFSLMHTLEGHTNWVRPLSFSPDCTRIVSGSNDGSIRLWNPTAGSLLKKVDNAHTDYIWTVTHSPHGNLISSGGGDNTIKIWDATTLNLRRTFRQCKQTLFHPFGLPSIDK